MLLFVEEYSSDDINSLSNKSIYAIIFVSEHIFVLGYYFRNLFMFQLKRNITLLILLICK